nr:hypothetical protein Iba_chr10eCG14690 [Ipomoea batatas]
MSTESYCGGGGKVSGPESKKMKRIRDSSKHPVYRGGLVEGDPGEVNVGDDGEEVEDNEVEIEHGGVEGVVEPAAEGLVEGDPGEVNVGDDGEEVEDNEVEIEHGGVEGVVEPAAEVVVASAGVRLAEEVEDLGCDSRGLILSVLLHKRLCVRQKGPLFPKSKLGTAGNDVGAGEFQSGLGADDQIEVVAGEGEVNVGVAFGLVERDGGDEHGGVVATNKAVMEEEAEAGGWRRRWWGKDLVVGGGWRAPFDDGFKKEQWSVGRVYINNNDDDDRTAYSPPSRTLQIYHCQWIPKFHYFLELAELGSLQEAPDEN